MDGRSDSRPQVIWQIMDLVISLGIITLLFAMIFKLLPDVMIRLAGCVDRLFCHRPVFYHWEIFIGRLSRTQQP